MNWNLPHNQQKFSEELSKEMERVTMSWSSDLRTWYSYALEALKFCSVASLGIPAEHYAKGKMRQTEAQGINMNIVAVLVNQVERVSPDQMRVTVEHHEEMIGLNRKIETSWEAIADPFRQTVKKRLELMEGQPKNKMVIAQA